MLARCGSRRSANVTGRASIRNVVTCDRRVGEDASRKAWRYCGRVSHLGGGFAHFLSTRAVRLDAAETSAENDR